LAQDFVGPDKLQLAKLQTLSTHILAAMMSTPAVFCTPALPFESTPYTATPLVFHNESYPWAAKTPEDSPMCSYVTPTGFPIEDVLKKLPMGPAMPRELIRKACEPFFEEMLTALQEGLQTQLHPGNKLADIAEAMIYHANSSYQMQKAEDSFRSRFNCPSGQLKQVLDDDSTEAEDLGAFASLLSASEGESVDGNDAPSPNTEISAGQDFELASETDKSTMVCRHWKTKGWCRLESNCKFLHPEHKRGIAAPKCAGAKGTSGGISQTDISTVCGAVPSVLQPCVLAWTEPLSFCC